jgi:hypothetical protein
MQFYQVEFRAVAFVLAEAILGKARAKVAHNRVAGDLGNHTGGGDAEAEAIAIDDRRLRQRKRKNRETVDEDVVGLKAQGADGSAHRLVGGAQDVDRINLNRIDDPDRPRDRAVRDQFVINLFAALREKLLRVVQPAVPEFFGKDDCGGYDRAGERTAARFVDAGDRRDTERAQSAFMPETTATVHSGKIPKR